MHAPDDLPPLRWAADLIGRLPSRIADTHAVRVGTRKASSGSRRGKWALRRQAVGNLIQMGHCAPTVMQTLLDVSNTRKEWLVKLSAGMREPSGIRGTNAVR